MTNLNQTSAATSNQSLELEKAIARTIVFFDMFNYPLTAYELWQLIDYRAELIDVKKCLVNFDNGFLANKVALERGFYFLAGREDLLKGRNDFYNLANVKNKIAERAARFLRFVPGLKMMAVCNNFYYQPVSDIDIFIVSRKNYLWLVRGIVTILVHLLGKRRHGQKVSNRLCLSFYVSEAGEDLKPLTLESDPYFYYWLAFLTPLYEDRGYYRDFLAANGWVKAKLPNLHDDGFIYTNKIKDNFGSLILKKVFYIMNCLGLGKIMEAGAKKIQLKKMAKNINSLAKDGDTRVVISDMVLKFHENDRRAQFLENFNKHYEKIFENNN
jgi:hypothetical protein